MISRFVLILSLVGVLMAQCTTTNATINDDSNDTNCTCDGSAIYNPFTQRCQCQPNVPLEVDDSCLRLTALSCLYPCLSCQNYDQCSSCPLNYILVNHQCQQISKSVVGEILYGNKTYECLGGCQICTNLHICTQCSLGYRLVNQTCQPCFDGCRTCAENQCTSCFVGYYLAISGCEQCNEGCLECNSIACINCQENYYNSNGFCIRCEEFCKRCTEFGCIECIANYIVPIGGDECVECLNGCTLCSSHNISLCIACSQGYYDNAGSCQLCSIACTACQNQFICQSCLEGYVLSNYECRQPCQFPCFKCTGQKCFECYGGYNLSQDNSCIPDISCSNGICEYCPRHYFLSQGKCLSCQVSNCERCSSAARCIQCREGHYLQNEQKCSSCPFACGSCISNLSCLSCGDGYVMKKEGNVPIGKCISCHDHCLRCKNAPHQCMECKEGYYLEKSRCMSVVNIGLKVIISISLEQFVIEMNEFKRILKKAMGMEGGISLIVIHSIHSSEVCSQIIIEDATQAQTYYHSLQSQQQFGIFTISSIEANGFSPQEEQPPTEEQNVKVIVGAVCGALIVIGIIIIIAIFKKKASNEDMAPNQKLKREEITSLHFDEAQ